MARVRGSDSLQVRTRSRGAPIKSSEISRRRGTTFSRNLRLGLTISMTYDAHGAETVEDQSNATLVPQHSKSDTPTPFQSRYTWQSSCGWVLRLGFGDHILALRPRSRLRSLGLRKSRRNGRVHLAQPMRNSEADDRRFQDGQRDLLRRARVFVACDAKETRRAEQAIRMAGLRRRRSTIAEPSRFRERLPTRLLATSRMR